MRGPCELKGGAWLSSFGLYIMILLILISLCRMFAFLTSLLWTNEQELNNIWSERL